MNVLIVDDSHSLRQQLRADLEEVGIAVTEAENGAEALNRADEGGRFDLVISDVNMPDMDGLSFIEALRRGESRKTPVFMLSAERSSDAKARAKAAGVTAWIVKPYVKDRLVSAVSRVAS